MFAFILRRLLLMIPTTFGVALVIFAIFHAAPGDPATVMMGAGGAGDLSSSSDVEGRVARFRRKHGLDRSLVVQFLDYVGPVNLSRDGASWFSSPYTERTTEEVELEGGGTLVLGEPLLIGTLPGTDPLDADHAEEWRMTLLDDGAGQSSWDEASRGLAGLEDEGLPAIFTSLFELRNQSDQAGGAVDRTLAALSASTDFRMPEGIDASSRVGRAFGWYYTEGGGYRVQNTGENTWGGLLALDLGKEMQGERPIGAELLKRMSVSVPLSLISVMLAYLLAIPAGIFSVRNRGTRRDGLVTVVLFVLFAIPTFWAGLMLLQIFGKTGWDLLPVLGLHDKDADQLGTFAYAWDTIKHCILPIVTLTYGSLAYLSRQMRAGMMDVISQDYIRTARAKGLSENVVIYKHALRNSMIPVITLLASILPVLIGGSIIVEMVFDIPGMGLYAFEGLTKRDFNILMATTILVGIMTQVGILLSDITYSLVDPRIRHE
ncbi:MAG: ABC transporter permease [Planctomycetota bacterium]|nr:ABC transporter permease [Planctomycetota bacterium]